MRYSRKNLVVGFVILAALFVMVQTYLSSPTQRVPKVETRAAAGAASCVNNPNARIVQGGESLAILNTDTSKTIFCLQPGTYEPVTLTRSGTAGSPRVIRYYDPGLSDPNNYPSPWKQSESKRAIIKLLTVQAGYWIIGGITFTDTAYHYGLVKFQAGTTHVTLNNVLVEKGVDMVQPQEGEYITIQNSVIRQSTRRPGTDSHCIITSRAKYTKILNNEIYDCTDGIQMHAGTNNTNSPDGTMIEGNEIYITDALYADCSNPDLNSSLTPSGECACTEEGIDIKATTTKPLGSVQPQDMTRIRNNVFYGFRKTHPTCGGSGGGGETIGLNDHPNVRFIMIENNVLADARGGVTVGTGVEGVTIRNNLFYDIYDRAAGDFGVFYFVSPAQKVEAYHNTVLGTGKADIYLRHSAYAIEFDVRNNLFISSGKETGTSAGRFGSTDYVGFNGFFDTQEYSNVLSSTTNVRGSVAQTGLGGQYCYVKNKFTNPHSVCIANVIPQAGSPVIDKGDPQVGLRKGIGIDNQLGVAMDLTGKTRDSQPDIGAFEYGGSAVAQPTPTRILTPVQGDVNNDWIVNGLDYVILFESFRKRTGQTGFNPAADITGDGVVNALDYVILFEQFGKSRV